MRWTAILLTGCLIPLLVGCRLWHSAAHNLVNEPIAYLDEKKVTRQLREEAEDLLKEMCRNGGRVFSNDFRDGFIDGYADFLERGGNTAPPAVPPLKYRRGRFLNPDGHARIQDYFAGFQTGADTAAHTGKRQFLTVPVLMPDPPTPNTANARQIPADQCAPTATGGASTPAAGELLPQPRGMDPATGLPAPDRPLAKPPADPNVPPVPKAPPPATDPPKGGGTEIDAPLPAIPLIDDGGTKAAPPPKSDPIDGRSTGMEPALIESGAGFQRMVVPPLRDLPRKPGR